LRAGSSRGTNTPGNGNPLVEHYFFNLSSVGEYRVSPEASTTNEAVNAVFRLDYLFKQALPGTTATAYALQVGDGEAGDIFLSNLATPLIKAARLTASWFQNLEN